MEGGSGRLQVFEKFDNESDFAKERTGRVLLFESKELDILHTVPRRDPSRAKRYVGEGRVVWGNRWELGEVRSHLDPVTCEALSITRNLDFCLSIQGRALLQHYRLV